MLLVKCVHKDHIVFGCKGNNILNINQINKEKNNYLSKKLIYLALLLYFCDVLYKFPYALRTYKT